MASPKVYRFSFGPWNISTGADPFGPPVRREMAYADKLRSYRKLGLLRSSSTMTTLFPPISTGQRPRRVRQTSRRSWMAKGLPSSLSPLGSGKILGLSMADSHRTANRTVVMLSIERAGPSISPA
jgi:hypothetical protein